VRNEYPAREMLEERPIDILEGWRIRHHRIRDTGEHLNRTGYPLTGIDEGAPGTLGTVAVDLNQTDLDDPMSRRMTTRRLKIDTD
jgi:hypothetical protein